MIERDYRLDILRAFAISLVLLWHIQPLRFSVADHHFRLASAPGYVMDIFNFQFTLIAVPLFFLISLYLFYSHTPVTTTYLKHRLRRISTTYVFWTAVQFMAYLVMALLAHHLQIASLRVEMISPVKLLIQGGPPLPYVGDSVVYFLFDLFVLMALAYLYARIDDRIRMYVGVAIVLGSMAYFEIAFLHGWSIPYWRIDNFLLYIPIAHILKNHDSSHKYWYFLLSLFMVFCVHNLVLAGTGGEAYARISIVLGAVGFFCMACSRSAGVPTRFTRLLSHYSLGIFAVHKYCQLFFILFFHLVFLAFGIDPDIVFFGIKLSLIFLLIGIFTFAFSMACVLLVGRTRLKAYVS